jgi:hypothetical protein
MTTDAINSVQIKASGWNGYALVIAIADYETVSRLPAAVQNDARDVQAALISPSHCGYPLSNVKLLLDGEATLAGIRAQLSWLASVAGSDDSVVIYFSGHGARLAGASGHESFLVPVDGVINDLHSSSVSETELSMALKSIQSARLLILLDACHSGGAVFFNKSQGSEVLESGFDEKSLRHLAEGVGRVVIASSRSTETSLITPGGLNSVFTHHLLEALRGEIPSKGDGFIRVFQVFEHVAAAVPRATGERQHPIFKASDVETNFPMALDKGGNKLPEGPESMHLPPVFDWSQFELILSELYPLGPLDREIWARAGGDLSQLKLQQPGQVSWFSSLLYLRQGGGTEKLKEYLLSTAIRDFPNHPGLIVLSRSLGKPNR